MAIGGRLLALGYQQLIVMNTGVVCIIIPNRQQENNYLTISELTLILEQKNVQNRTLFVRR
jgi:hypothetical protein